MWNNPNILHESVADVLNKAGFKSSSERAGKTIKGGSVRSWHERTMGPDCPFEHEYRQALDASEGAEPKVLLRDLGIFARSLMFVR